jgi:hypothetical protein
MDMLVKDYPHAKHCTQFLLDTALEAEAIKPTLSAGNVVLGSC